jgi:hypothetical protein
MMDQQDLPESAIKEVLEAQNPANATDGEKTAIEEPKIEEKDSRSEVQHSRLFRPLKNIALGSTIAALGIGLLTFTFEKEFSILFVNAFGLELRETIIVLVSAIIISFGFSFAFSDNFSRFIFENSVKFPASIQVEESVYEVRGDFQRVSSASSYPSRTTKSLDLAFTPNPIKQGSIDEITRKITKDIRSSVEKKITNEFLNESFDNAVKTIAERRILLALERIIYIQDRSLQRLGRQVEVLGVRANRSQYVGIGFAISGLLLLYASFFTNFLNVVTTASPAGTGIIALLERYLPRFSLIILVEIVAFFFLRLYTKTLSELRYVQNEITNAESRFLALHSALNGNNDSTLAEVTIKLASIDRNAVIEKSQTTVDIEKERASSESGVATLKALNELLHGNEHGWFGRKRS